MQQYNFVIHSLKQGLMVANLAKKKNKQVTVFSAPAAGASLGPEVFSEMMLVIQKRYSATKILAVLDCGSLPGVALSAMRRGITDIHCQLSGDAKNKIVQIASKNFVTLHPKPCDYLDLNCLTDLEHEVSLHLDDKAKNA